MTTDSLDRCERTDLLVDQCGHCRKDKQNAAFRAQYPDTCTTCGSPISSGSQIRETVHGRYEHSWHA